MKKITLLIVFLLSNVIGFSQTTVTIGTGTSASGTSDNGNPIYRSSATSGFSFSQSVQLLTQADLSSVGLSGGSTITKIAYYKTNTSTMGAGRTADLKIYLKNSGSTSLVTTQNMTTWTTGATLCYSNPAVSDTNIPATAGWVEFTFTTPFNYTGGSIEVAIDWTGNGAGSGLTTGAFLWQYTAATAVKAVGTSNSSAITGNLTTSQSRLYNTQLTFSNSPCTGVPAPGNTIASNLTPCAGGTVTFTTQNPTMGSGVTYQWYNSSGTISGATNSTYSQSITSSDSFHCEVTCAGNTTATTPVSVTPLIINSFPWLEEFNTFLPNCWQAADNGDLISGPATFGSSSWVADGFGNNGTTGSIRYEIWLAAANDWIISPLVSIPATGYELKFDAAVTQWNTTAAPTVPWESDDFVEVLVSTSLSNWTVLYTYNDTNVPSPTGDANIINLDAYAGQNVRFAFRVVEGTANGLADLNFYVDNFQIRQTPSCLEPTLLTVNTITANSATLGWTELGTASTWEIEYGPAGFVNGTGTLVPASTNPFVLNGLISNTSYDFYVRTVCGATQLSYWAGPMAFKTKCNDLTDYVENFDTYTTGTNSLPECWSRGGTSLNTYITNGAVAPMSPSNRLYINASGITPTEAYAILPAVSNLQANTHRLKFKAFSTTANSPLQIGYLTDPTDMNTFIQLEEITLPSTLIQNTQEFTIVPVGIPAGVKHLAIRNSGYPGAVTTAYIDDVKWELIPACPEPMMLSTSSITSSSAQLNWIEGGSATTWNIEYGSVGFVLGTGTSINAITANPYTLNGLTPSTAYSFYVQASCGSTNGNSVWVGPFNFSTPCLPYTIPYFEGFESGYTHNVAVSGCLSQSSVTGTPVWTANNTLTTFNRTPRTGNWNAFLEYSNEDWLFIPIELVGGTSYTVELYARQDGATAANSNMLVSYGSSATAAAMTNAIVPSTGIINGNYQLISGAFTPSANGTYYVGIKGFMNSSPWYISLDDIKIDVTPSCLAPTNLTALNITSNSANLGWTENGTSANWDIEWGTSGFTPTGTPNIAATTTNPQSLTGLSPNTTYSFYVRSNCGSTIGSSTWSGPFSFTTSCVPYTIPYFEGFESGYTHNAAVAGCLSQSSVTGASVWTANNTLTTYNRTPRTGNWNAFLQYSNEDWLFIPIELVGGTSYTVELYARQDGATAANSNMLVSYGSSATAAAMTNAIVPSTGIINGNYQLISGAFTPSANGIYYVGIKGFMNSSPWYISLDDIKIDVTPSCVAPTATNVTATTQNSLAFAWTASPTETGGYEWRVMNNGSDVNVVTPAASGSVATGVTNALATGLVMDTTYQIYVRTLCGTSETSAWSTPLTAIVGYCVPSGTSNATYVDNFSTTLGATNITNTASGFSTANYGNFTSQSVSVGSTQSFNFNIVVAGGTLGCAIWVDWNNNLVFDANEMVFSTTSYGSGPYTGTISVPAATANGNYRMRVMVDYNDSNPGDDDACTFANGRGEIEDYTITVNNALSNETFDNASFVAYPNPVKDVLNLSYSTEITFVKVINLLGQEVISRKIGSASTQLDMSNLTAGAYIVNVTVNNVTKTIKVIKQ